MSDLQINVALAEACGWLPSSKYAVMHGQYQVFRKILTCNKDGVLRKFDYRDLVIFEAICKRWELRLDYGFRQVAYSQPNVLITRGFSKEDAMQRSAALVVIELAKRGVK